jgi:hypothetical protein
MSSSGLSLGRSQKGVSTRHLIAVALLVIGLLVPLSWLLLVAIQPPHDFQRARLTPRIYTQVPLGTVLDDFRTAGVLPDASWESKELQQRPVSVTLLFPTYSEALESVARAAGVVIEYPVRDVDQIVAPCRVRSTSPDEQAHAEEILWQAWQQW